MESASGHRLLADGKLGMHMPTSHAQGFIPTINLGKFSACFVYDRWRPLPAARCWSTTLAGSDHARTRTPPPLPKLNPQHTHNISLREWPCLMRDSL